MLRFNLLQSKKMWAVMAYMGAAMLGAVGQFCFKMLSSEMMRSSAASFVFSPYLWVGVGSYFGVMGLFVWGLRLYRQMSVLYPVYATTFVWASLLAVLFLGERLSTANLCGILLIIVGIFFLNLQLSASALDADKSLRQTKSDLPNSAAQRQNRAQ